MHPIFFSGNPGTLLNSIFRKGCKHCWLISLQSESRQQFRMKLPSPTMNSLKVVSQSNVHRSGYLFPQRQSAGLCARITSACPRGKEISGCKREKLQGKIETVWMFTTSFTILMDPPKNQTCGFGKTTFVPGCPCDEGLLMHKWKF